MSESKNKLILNSSSQRWNHSLTVEQFHRLLRHPLIENEPYRTMAVLAGCAGLRRGELFALEWFDVDSKAKGMRNP